MTTSKLFSCHGSFQYALNFKQHWIAILGLLCKGHTVTHKQIHLRITCCLRHTGHVALRSIHHVAVDLTPRDLFTDTGAAKMPCLLNTFVLQDLSDHPAIATPDDQHLSTGEASRASRSWRTCFGSHENMGKCASISW